MIQTYLTRGLDHLTKCGEELSMGAGACLLYLDLFVAFSEKFKVQYIVLTNCGQGKIGSTDFLSRNFNTKVAQRT